MKKFLITLFIIAFLVGGALLGAHIYRANKKNSNPVDVYGVSNWLGNYYDMEQSLSGTVVLSDEQTVYIERDKIINDIHATPGDAVKIGDVLIEYDMTQEQLKLNSMMAELAVTETNLRLANNQLVKLQNITPIPDGSEVPKTEKELAVEAAQAELDKAQEAAVQPAIDEATAGTTLEDKTNNLKLAAKDYDESNIKRYNALKAYNDFMGLPTDEKEPEPINPELNPKKQDDEPSEESTEVPTEEPSEEYQEGYSQGYYEGIKSSTENDFKEKETVYIKAEQEYIDAKTDYLQAENALDAANAAVAAAQKKYDEAFEAQQKEYEEQLENPTPVYTESELKRAIRLKNEDIKDLNLSIANQNLAIKRQQNVIAKGTVVSELDGIIQTVDISEESIAGGQPAIVISSEGSYSARVSVDEFSLDEMEIGEEVSILSYDTGSTYYGKVSKKSEAPSNDGYSYYEYTASSYPVTIVIEGGEDLSEGMWVEVTRNSDVSWGEKSNEIVLPLAFCKKEKGSYYVMKREGDRLKKQYISTGKIYWGQYIVVKSGLKPDDFIAFPYAKDAVEGKVCKEADISDLYGY